MCNVLPRTSRWILPLVWNYLRGDRLLHLARHSRSNQPRQPQPIMLLCSMEAVWWRYPVLGHWERNEACDGPMDDMLVAAFPVLESNCDFLRRSTVLRVLVFESISEHFHAITNAFKNPRDQCV